MYILSEWQKLQNLSGFQLAPGIMNKKYKNIFGIQKTMRVGLSDFLLKFGMSSGREQNIKKSTKLFF